MMSQAYVTIVGTMTGADGTAQEVTIQGMADVISFRPGSPPPRPHPGPRPPSGPVDPGYGYPERPVDPGYGIPETGVPHPSHPIMLPGMPGWPKPPEGTEPPLKPVIAWTPDTGWVVVYVPTGEHVTPSK
jgi:hypothetical protein